MKLIILFVGLVVTVIGGEWAYRTLLRPVDPLAVETVALSDHLARNGLPNHPFPVRHGFRHSKVLSSAVLKLPNYRRPMIALVCSSDAAAAAMLADIRTNPNMRFPGKAGRVVTYFPMWSDDSAPMAERVSRQVEIYAAGI